MVKFVSLEVVFLMKVELKFVKAMFGVQYVMIAGVHLMPRLFVVNLVTQKTVSQFKFIVVIIIYDPQTLFHLAMHILVLVLVVFILMMFNVLELRLNL